MTANDIQAKFGAAMIVTISLVLGSIFSKCEESRRNRTGNAKNIAQQLITKSICNP